MANSFSKLKEIQSNFRNFIYAEEKDIFSEINSEFTDEIIGQIYKNNFYRNIYNFFQIKYPIIHKLYKDKFDKIISTYLSNYPSISGNIAESDYKFLEFLVTAYNISSPFIGELAKFEHHIYYLKNNYYSNKKFKLDDIGLTTNNISLSNLRVFKTSYNISDIYQQIISKQPITCIAKAEYILIFYHDDISFVKLTLAEYYFILKLPSSEFLKAVEYAFEWDKQFNLQKIMNILIQQKLISKIS